ncbi:MAG: hypothetical protein LBC59_07960 [Chitinispirillales bacterium]|jgi:hypothetical protein|nr:hypothetical protein [Chitinispirillales bacterium]
MITLHEAYLKAKSYGEKYGRTRLVDCRDYGDFWGFDFVSPMYKKGDNGNADITINKKTGEKSSFNPIMDLDLAEKSTPIPIEQFAEYNVAI